MTKKINIMICSHLSNELRYRYFIDKRDSMFWSRESSLTETQNYLLDINKHLKMFKRWLSLYHFR